MVTNTMHSYLQAKIATKMKHHPKHLGGGEWKQEDKLSESIGSISAHWNWKWNNIIPTQYSQYFKATSEVTLMEKKEKKSIQCYILM